MKVKVSIQITSFLLSFLILFQSCTGYNSNTVKISYSGEDLFRGIFFFDGEVASKLDYFAELRDMLETNEEKDKFERDKLITSIIANVNEINPNFFDEFQATIESGHLNRINDALNYGAELSYVALTKTEYSGYANLVERASNNLNKDDYELNTQEGLSQYSNDLYSELKKYDSSLASQSEGRVLAVCVAVLVAAVAIFITAAAAFNYVMAAQVVALALAFNIAYARDKAWGPPEQKVAEEPTDILEKERFILEIAENFSKDD